MRLKFLSVLVIICSCAYADTRVPVVTIDSLKYAPGTPSDLHSRIYDLLSEKKKMIENSYYRLIYRSERARGQVAIDLYVDSAGILDSAFIIQVSPRIAEKVFLDSFNDIFKALPHSPSPNYKTRAVIGLNSRKEASVNGTGNDNSGIIVLRIISVLLSTVTLIILTMNRGY